MSFYRNMYKIKFKFNFLNNFEIDRVFFLYLFWSVTKIKMKWKWKWNEEEEENNA